MKQFKFIPTFLLLAPWIFLSAAAGEESSTTVYRYVDEEGVVHFSDFPTPGSEKLEVEHVGTYPAGKPPVLRPEKRKPSLPDTGVHFGVHIVSPKDGETVHAGGGNLNVGVATDLRGTDKSPERFSVRLYLDGKEVAHGSGSGGGFSIPNVARGPHTLRAELLEGTRARGSSPPITIHMKRPSALFPNRKAAKNKKVKATLPPSPPQPSPPLQPRVSTVTGKKSATAN